MKMEISKHQKLKKLVKEVEEMATNSQQQTPIRDDVEKLTKKVWCRRAGPITRAMRPC